MKSVLFSSLFLIGIMATAVPQSLGKEKSATDDVEEAKHGSEAAYHQVVEEETHSDFIFKQFNLSVLSHYSYLVGSQDEALIVDPSRDVDVYVEYAKNLGLKITRIYLTHSHADFVAGHMELAKRTGANIFINKASGVEYTHSPLEDNSEIRFGNIRALIRATPGHTPDGTCMYLYYPANASSPKMVFTGDTLFIGSVGRPDLMGGKISAAELAAMGYHTWHNILSRVPDNTLIYPAHGAGSLCGAHLSDEPVSTFGEQKRVNPFLKNKDLNSYVMAVIDGLPPAPQYFKHNAKMNGVGPKLVNWTHKMPSALTPDELSEILQKGALLLDVRDTKEFAEGHIKGAINIPIRGRFETWTGIMIPWGKPFVLLGSDMEVAEAKFRLTRIGYDNPAGFLQGGFSAWEEAKKPANTIQMVNPRALHRQIQEGTAPVLVDVRLPKEWMGLRIAKSLLNMPLDTLALDAERLDPKMPVMTICNSAYRSSMGASVLLKAGFKDVRNLEGGGQAWIEAGLPTYSTKKNGDSASEKKPAYVPLPGRVEPQALAKALFDLPDSVEIVDIRPRWQFEEFHLPHSTNVPVSDLVNDPAYLVDQRPLIVVCRDGSISAAVAGAIFSKSERPIKYLVGGIARYWDEVMRPSGVISDPMSTGDIPVPRGSAAGEPSPKPTPEVAPSPVEPKEPSKKRKKRPSAGC